MSSEPVRLILRCPRCGLQHIDADEWATLRHHKTHLCKPEDGGCANQWRPFEFATVGIGADPEDASACTVAALESGHDGPGYYYWDTDYPEEGSCGAFETLEEAVREAVASDYLIVNVGGGAS